MSTDQPTLEDYLGEQVASEPESAQETVDVLEGAAYGQGRNTTRNGEPADAGCCKNCGHDLRADPDIPADVLRVCGDNHDRTPVCNRQECRIEVFGNRDTGVENSILSKTVGRYRQEVSEL